MTDELESPVIPVTDELESLVIPETDELELPVTPMTNELESPVISVTDELESTVKVIGDESVLRNVVGKIEPREIVPVMEMSGWQLDKLVKPHLHRPKLSQTYN